MGKKGKKNPNQPDGSKPPPKGAGEEKKNQPAAGPSDQQQQKPQGGPGGDQQRQPRGDGQQQQKQKPQGGPGGDQQRQPRGDGQQQQQQRGPGGGQQHQPRGDGQQQQQQRGPGGGQQHQPRGDGQQQPWQQQQQRGPGADQQYQRRGDGQQQQQQRGPGGGQQQPWQQRGPSADQQQQQQRGPGAGQQQPWQQQQRGPAGGPQQQQQRGPGGGQQQPWQQQQRGPSADQQQQQQRGPGAGQQQPWQQQQRGPAGGPQQQQQRGPAGGPQQQQQRGPGGGQQQPWQQQQRGPVGGPQQQQQQRGPAGGPQQQQQRGPAGGPQQQQQRGPGGGQQQPWQQQQRGPGGDQQYQRRGDGQQQQQRGPGGGQQQQQIKQSAAIKGVKSDYFVANLAPDRDSLAFIGVEGSKHQIEANYVKVNMEKLSKVAYQYDVKFEPDRPLRTRPEAFEQFRVGTLGVNRRPRGFPIAFDGMNIAFSAERIAKQLLNTAHTVAYVDSETNASKEVSVTIMEATDVEIDLTLLSNYQTTGIRDGHIRAVQCLDVVLRSAPARMSRQAGRAFYQRPDELMDLGDGFALWLGLFQSLTLGDYPMLNIDVAHKGFPRASNLVDVYNEFRDRTDQYLKNLNIIYDPPPCMNGISKLYKANGLVAPARTLQFENENHQMITVEAYYKSKNYVIKNPTLPCVSVGARGISLPLELCRIQEGQDVRKRAGPNQIRNLIRYAATATDVRKQKIMNLFNAFNYNTSEIIRGFNISLGSEFIKLIARNIPPPKIQYANGVLVPQKGSWRADTMSFLKGAAMKKWAILVTVNRFDDRKVGAFAGMIIAEAKRNNMPLSEDYKKETQTDTRRLHDVFQKFKDDGYSIVFVIITGVGNSYAQVKQRAEIDHGILTQCVKAFTIERKMDRSTIANIFLKVNSKLNGTNHILQPARNIPINNTKMAVMFLGADVTHPSPDQSYIPSVVGVVGSFDPQAYHYKISWRLQSSRMEMIEDMEGIMADQLQNFAQKCGTLPTHIIYYRDGVSNGQFAELNRIELNAINRACAKIPNCKPKVTCLVVQKRHHTRFFPASPGIVHKFDKNKNVLPGTVVDNTITHPGQKQFFLVSHESIQGTAKPTKYCVIRDDENFKADELQALTYSLCHLFTRCNRTVSYPAPAYYAHHVAARGRVYIDGARIDNRNLDREYKSRNVDSIIRSNPMFFV